MLAISADSHVTEPGDCYAPRIDPRFRDRAPEAVTHDTMGAVMLIDNGATLVPYGIAAEVLYPSVGMLLCNLTDADYKKACFDAYNLWMAEFQALAPQRLIGI